MAYLNWTDQTISDLINISAYIEKDSRTYAKITINKIRSSARRIRDFPLSGRIVPEINVNEIREVFVGNYRLIYFIVEKDRIDILSVYHSARMLNIQEIRKHSG